MTDYLLILVSTILVNNFVLVQFLGLCPFMGVSNKLETAIGMGADEARDLREQARHVKHRAAGARGRAHVLPVRRERRGAERDAQGRRH